MNPQTLSEAPRKPVYRAACHKICEGPWGAIQNIFLTGNWEIALRNHCKTNGSHYKRAKACLNVPKTPPENLGSRFCNNFGQTLELGLVKADQLPLGPVRTPLRQTLHFHSVQSFFPDNPQKPREKAGIRDPNLSRKPQKPEKAIGFWKQWLKRMESESTFQAHGPPRASLRALTHLESRVAIRASRTCRVSRKPTANIPVWGV